VNLYGIWRDLDLDGFLTREKNFLCLKIRDRTWAWARPGKFLGPGPDPRFFLKAGEFLGLGNSWDPGPGPGAEFFWDLNPGPGPVPRFSNLDFNIYHLVIPFI
jgi:hypothetical protein